MKRMKLEKKNILKAVVAFAVAMAFIMPGATSVANNEMDISNIDDGTFAGTTIYVDDSNTAGPWNGTIDYPYQYIQDGIDATIDGDIIIVYDGDYSENLVVDKGVSLQTEASSVFVVGEHIITVDNVSINGFTFNNSAGYTITIDSSTENRSNTLITQCTFNLVGWAGVHLGGDAGGNKISSVEISHSTFNGPSNHLSNPFKIGGFFGSPSSVEIGGVEFMYNAVNNGSIPINLQDSNINGITIAYTTFRDTDGIVYLWGEGTPSGVLSNFVFKNNTVDATNSYGVGFDPSNPPVFSDANYGTGNLITYNTFDGISGAYGFGAVSILSPLTSYTLNATYNWWGHTSGPYHPTTNPNGLGDNVSDNVEFVPWIGYYSWSVLLNIEEQYGVVGDTVIFGEKPDAFDIQDSYDAPKPDIPPIPYVYAWFDAGLPEPYNRLWEDYRDYPTDSEVWDLYITCNTTTPLASVNLIISWNTTDTDTTEYDHIRLYDLSDVLLADMKAVESYVFSAEFEYLYHFQIRCSMNNIPIAYDDFYTTGEDVPLTVPALGVLGNDEDVENTPLIALLESDVSNGTLTLNADGSFEYIPSIGFTKDDSFAYKANDGIDNSTPATVTITVLERHNVPLQQYWNLMSLPVSELMDKTQIVIRSSGTDYTWSEAVSGHIILDNLYDWNTTTQRYVMESSTFKPGRAYWMWAYQNCELLVYSNDIGTGDITTLQLKWNLVGFPHDTSLVKEKLIVNYGGVDYTWDEATTSNNPTGSPIVLKFLYGWERTIQRYAYADSFDAGEGYWMYAYKACTLANPLV